MNNMLRFANKMWSITTVVCDFVFKSGCTCLFRMFTPFYTSKNGTKSKSNIRVRKLFRTQYCYLSNCCFHIDIKIKEDAIRLTLGPS